MSGAKSRCMPQAASVALTWSDSKFSSSQARGEASSRRIVSSAPLTPFLRQAFQAVPASARTLIGEPSSRNRCSASPGKAATRRRQVSASAGREGGDARGGLLEIGADPEPAAVGKGAGEAIGDGRELQPVRFQFICIFPVEGRAGEQAQIHRAEIVPEAGKRVFARSGPRRRSSHCARKPRLSSLSSARCAAHARLLWPAPTSMASNSLTPRPTFLYA